MVCLGNGETGSPAETPQILPSVVDLWLLPYVPEGPSMKCKPEEMGGLGKCWKKS